MAVTVVTTKMAGGVNYTHTTDASVDWPSVPNDTYFYDIDTEMVYYKDTVGTVISGYEKGGLTTVTTDGTTIIGNGTPSSPLTAVGAGTTINVYDEFLGTGGGEWNVSTTSSALLNATTNPYSGIIHISTTSGFESNRYIAFQDSPYTINSGHVTFWLNAKASMVLASTYIRVGFFVGGSLVGTSVKIGGTPAITYGFNGSIVGTYQLVTIPIADFGSLPATIDELRFFTTLGPSGAQFDLDLIKIEETAGPGLDTYTFSQNQWSKVIPLPVNLPDGTTANGFTFFDNIADRTLDGTTTYDQYNIAFSISIFLDGTGGTANINVNGTNYLATFNTDLATTAQDFVTTHGAAILSDANIRTYALGTGSDGRIRFANDSSDVVLNAITITNVTPNLNGALLNEFTGDPTASSDHIRIQYLGKPYEGLRLNHNFRVNFEIDPGLVQTLALSLRRFEDDSIIGSEIPVLRNADEPGKQFNFISYTAGASDPFVTGGFWFALRNDSGTSNIDIQNAIGILIQTYYQKPVNF